MGLYDKYKQWRAQKAAQHVAPQSGGLSFSPKIILNAAKQTDLATALIIVLAYLIWWLDNSPYTITLPLIGKTVTFGFGEVYRGYSPTKLLVLNTNWFTVFTSSIVTVLLLWNVFSNILHKDISFVFSFIIIGIINSSTSYYIWEKSFQNQIINWIALGVFCVVAYMYLRKRGFNFSGDEQATYIAMVLVYSFLWVNWSWTADVKAIIHVTFITVFCLLYIGLKPDINRSGLYLLTAVFLVADFFLYSMNFGNVALSKFPILVILTTLYSAQYTESKFARTNIIITAVIIGIILVFGAATSAAQPKDDSLTKKEPESGPGFLEEFGKAVSNIFVTKPKEAIETQLTYATGGTYRSQVEKNQFEPLGVYFDRVRAAQPRFYTDEPVTLWATIKSRTLSDPAVVTFTCKRWEDGKPKPIVTEVILGEKDTLIPDFPFTVRTLEDKDVECTFRKKLKTGTNTVTLSATYNFATSAYRKSYFINRERLRSMLRENIIKSEADALKVFGITDTKPATIHTNGPVGIAVGIQNLMAVADDIEVLPALDIVLSNREEIKDGKGKTVGKWEGKISEIKELVVVLPEGLTIEKPETCTPAPFIKVDNKQAYCEKSCLNVCTKSCDEFRDSTKKQQCIDDCQDPKKSETRERCDKDCAILFKEETKDVNYEGYYLDTSDVTNVKNIRDIDKNRQFVCRIKPTTKILENTPITTKFIRILARYDYLIEKSYTVTVQSPPTLQLDASDEDVLRKAIEKAKLEGVDIPVSDVKGLIFLESSGKHCCKEKGKIFSDNCVRDDAKTTCAADEIITSYEKSSIGIKQINIKPKFTDRNEKLTKNVCSVGQTIYTRECNLKVGIEILKDYYKEYINGYPDKEKLKKFCPENQVFDGIDLYKLYSTYKGFDAALRAYNGWSCDLKFIEGECRKRCKTDESCKNCVRNTVFYVKRVRDAGGKIARGELPDPIPDLDRFVQTVEEE